MNVFRSINIRDDQFRTEVVSAYRPTRKSLQVVRAVCGGERSTATHVVAPYGSGKSLAALAGITMVAGEASVAEMLRRKLGVADPDLAARMARRSSTALVVLLHGACPDLPGSLAASAGLDDSGTLTDVLAGIQRKAREEDADRIIIVWDEFGQHLETLVREGRPEDLLAVQDLAEWVVRRSRPLVTLTTLMHQGVHHYTRRAADSARGAWKKIEGRFETLSLVDDGLDALEMLAEALDSDGSRPDAQTLARARAAGFFSEITDDAQLGDLLARTAPLTPAALYLLPRISAQVAQAERTTFRFLEEVVASAPNGQPILVAAIYDFFAPAMRGDTGPGGTHRRLVETETALSRAATELERQVIKTAALLQLGRSSERVKLARERLVYAVSEGTGYGRDTVENCIDNLVKRKLLLYRRRVDDVSVWHGADVDLGRMVAEEGARLTLERDPLEALERLFPPDAYTAPAYNHAKALTRFARARFVKAGDLMNTERFDELRALAETEDAVVALVVDATIDDPGLREIAAALPPHLIVALPVRSTEVTAVLADLLGIEALLDRPDVLDTDPLVKRELLELKAEAEASLRHSLDRLMNPDRGEVVWLSGATAYSFRDGITYGDVLSDIFEARFPDTPVIRSEQVVRRKVSAVARSARKRCILGILERSGLPSLGYEGSTAADASIYRTVLERTGLYASHEGIWRWSHPDEVTDPGMARVWRSLETFFSTPDSAAKSIERLLDDLLAPPVGLREGVVPIIVAAGLVAFGRALALRERVNGTLRYVDDIQPSVIEALCETPGRFELEVAPLTPSDLRKLEKMIRCLTSAPDSQEPDRVRGFYDALLAWRAGLPPTAFTTRGLGKGADALQPLIRRKNFDPLALLLKQLPQALSEKPFSKTTIALFEQAVAEMEDVTTAFARRAAEVSAGVFNSRLQGGDQPLLAAAEAWAECVPNDDLSVHALDHEARGVLTRARGARRSPRGERGFVTQLSGILCGEDFDAWDDNTVELFRANLEAAILRVEDAVLTNADGSDAFEPFLKNRLASIFDTYGSKIGRERLIQYLQEIYRETS